MERLWYLSQVSVLDAMSEQELAEIDQMNAIQHFNQIPNNVTVQTPDEPRQGLYFIKQGKLRLYKLSEDGKQFTVGILATGNMFGELESFSFGTKRVYMETMEPSLLCTMSEMQFEELLARRPKLALKFMKAMSDRLNERDELLEQLAFKDLKGRTLHLLALLADRFGVTDGEFTTIDFQLTHQEVANMLGATREAVSVAMRELVKEGSIRTRRMSIQIKRSFPSKGTG
ncbi:Global nitrogen regulator [compost metagenome]